MRLLKFFLFAIGLIALSLLGEKPTSHAQPPNASLSEASLEVLAQINAYRISVGVQPLSVNPILVEMARSQAEFVASQNFEPANWDFHLDAEGQYPRERGIRFKWRAYGDAPAQIQVGENAGLGDLRYVMNFWSTSIKHKTAMENPIYREVGVWTIPHTYGYLYIIVFGARPDVFPTPFDPTTCELYVTNEANDSGSGTWMKNIDELHFIGLGENEILPKMAWQARVALPTAPEEEFILEFIEANRRLRQNIKPLENIVVLPETLAIVNGQQPLPNNCAASAPITAATEPNQEIAITQVNSEVNVAQPAAVAGANMPVPPSAETEITYSPVTVAAVTPAIVAGTTSSGGVVNSSVPSLYPAAAAKTDVAPVLGMVNLNRGSNLHCRMYPNSTAQSVSLIPANTELVLLGVPAPRDTTGQIGFPDAPTLTFLDISSAAQEAVTPAETTSGPIDLQALWLWSEWRQATGERLGCWVNASYINLTYDRRLFLTVGDYVDLVDRGILKPVPYNVNGGFLTE